MRTKGERPMTDPDTRPFCDAQNINYGETCSRRATYTYVGGANKGQHHCTQHAHKRSRYARRIDRKGER